MKLTIEFLPQDFSVCQIQDCSHADLTQEFVFLGKTDEEFSFVCPTDTVPSQTLSREDGWTAFRIIGVLDFSLIGILADIANRLAQEKISIFALSTYNTDYVLIKKENREKAIKALETNYQIIIK